MKPACIKAFRPQRSIPPHTLYPEDQKLTKRRVISTTMNNMNTPVQQSSEPMLRKTIGKTTYLVSVRFSQTSKETIKDKLMRLLRREVMKM